LATHYNPSDWKEPEKYMPERFDPENEYFSSQSNISSFLPFSHGLRSCAGKSLAMLEMKVLVSYILLKLDKGML